MCIRDSAMGQLRIEKRDKTTDQLLEGAHFELQDEDGSVLEELVTCLLYTSNAAGVRADKSCG